MQLYAPLISHWCHRCGLDPHDSADCVQEVFAALARSLGTYEPRSSSGAFRAWLWTITRNKVRDLCRRKSHQPSAIGGSTAQHAFTEIPDQSSIPDDEPSETAQLDQLVRRGLEQVRSEFESTTWLSFWRSAIDGVPTAVVAEQLGLTAAAIRQNRSRVMRRLRQQLGDVV